MIEHHEIHERCNLTWISGHPVYNVACIRCPVSRVSRWRDYSVKSTKEPVHSRPPARQDIRIFVWRTPSINNLPIPPPSSFLFFSFLSCPNRRYQKNRTHSKFANPRAQPRESRLPLTSFPTGWGYQLFYLTTTTLSKTTSSKSVCIFSKNSSLLSPQKEI